MKLTTTLFIIFSLSTCLYGQDKKPKEAPRVKGHLLGGSLNFTDYTASLDGLAHLTPGLSLIYFKGLTPNVDFSLRGNAVITNYSKVSQSSLNRAIMEFEGSAHLKAFPNGKLVNPFLSAGIGWGNYSKASALYSPLGLGAELNFNSNVYLLAQVNYRLSYNNTRLDNNMFYSIGALFNLKINKKAKKKPVREPRIDTDGDGVIDSKDECPDKKGLPRFKGCPDTDNDGIQDKKDQCPDVPGIFRYKGCPVPDKDGDGVNDEEDKCPDVPGTVKRKGCPAPDTDGDGVNDDDDKCPTTKGPASNAGCPEVKAEVKKKLDFAATAILFEVERSAIREESFPLLDEIVGILREYNDHKLFVDGYTDNSGNAKKNMKLSKQRAQAVRDYLVSKGIPEERIVVNWHGDADPKVSNETAEGRVQNRRVEMALKINDEKK